MDSKVKISAARLKEIIQEEVHKFYGIEEEKFHDSVLEEEGMEEALTPEEQEKQRVVGAISAMTPPQVSAIAAKSGIKV